MATSALKSTGAGVLERVIAVEEPMAGEQGALFNPPCWITSGFFEDVALGVVTGVGVGAAEGVPHGVLRWNGISGHCEELADTQGCPIQMATSSRQQLVILTAVCGAVY